MQMTDLWGNPRIPAGRRRKSTTEQRRFHKLIRSSSFQGIDSDQSSQSSEFWGTDA
jgi:hypothetical protein